VQAEKDSHCPRTRRIKHWPLFLVSVTLQSVLTAQPSSVPRLHGLSATSGGRHRRAAVSFYSPRAAGPARRADAYDRRCEILRLLRQDFLAHASGGALDRPRPSAERGVPGLGGAEVGWLRRRRAGTIPSRMVTIGDQTLHPEDIALVPAPHWWNDSLIGFSIERLRRSLPPPVAVLPPSLTFFLAAEHASPADLCAQLGPHDLLSKALVLLPVNSASASAVVGSSPVVGDHWSVLAFEKASQTFSHFDSLPHAPNMAAAAAIAKSLSAFVMAAPPPDVDVVAARTPAQSGSSDCGPFAASVIQQLAAGAAGGAASVHETALDLAACASMRRDMGRLIRSVRNPA
jgi:hypothetical protein